MALQEQERKLILDLSYRLQESSAVIEKDVEAEQIILQTIANQKDVVYRLVQAVLVQQLALGQAQQDIRILQEKVHALESQSKKSTGFLGGLTEKLFGQQQSQQSPQQSYMGRPQSQSQPGQAYYGAGPGQPPPYGAPYANPAPAQGSAFAPNSFLGSALTTAAGVAGGMFLFHGISNLFGSHAAGAATGATAGDTTINNYYGDSAAGAGTSSDSFSSWNESNVPDTSINYDDFGGGGDSFGDW